MQKPFDFDLDEHVLSPDGPIALRSAIARMPETIPAGASLSRAKDKQPSSFDAADIEMIRDWMHLHPGQ